MSPRDVLDCWRADGSLTEAGYRLAIDELALDATGWQRWARRVLLALGTVSVLAGVLMIFASNWLTWPRLVQVGVAESIWLLALVVAFFVPRDHAAHRWGCFAAAALTGVVLAVIGQAYQTGADAWQLFAAWAALLLPWLLYLRWMPLASLFILVASLAIISGLGGHHLSVFDTPFDQDRSLSLTGLWGLALAVVWPHARTGSWRVLALALASLITLVTSFCSGLIFLALPRSLLQRAGAPGLAELMLVVWIVWLVLCWKLGQRRCDIVLAALVLFAVWLVVLCGVAGLDRHSSYVWLLAALAVAGLAAVGWMLHRLQRRWQET